MLNFSATRIVSGVTARTAANAVRNASAYQANSSVILVGLVSWLRRNGVGRREVEAGPASDHAGVRNPAGLQRHRTATPTFVPGRPLSPLVVPRLLEEAGSHPEGMAGALAGFPPAGEFAVGR